MADEPLRNIAFWQNTAKRLAKEKDEQATEIALLNKQLIIIASGKFDEDMLKVAREGITQGQTETINKLKQQIATATAAVEIAIEERDDARKRLEELVAKTTDAPT